MCGINGLFNFASVAVDAPDRLIAGMNASIRHRGPDGDGVWLSPDRKVALGHQRLSILDLSPAGAQPMVGERGSVIVFNGEIYNFESIRESFADRHFRSSSDTEVLQAAWERDGEQALSQLNGMFAFSIWDSQRGVMTLVRDRVGIKPVYYTEQNGIFAFSSEIRSLLTLPWVRAELDEDALYDFLTFNRVAPPATVFKGISKFHPGYLMEVGRKGIQRYEAWWEPQLTNLADAAEGRIEQMLRDDLKRSVGLRMVSDVPVGAFLSGGVDSSAVVALMSQHVSTPVRTFSIGFKDVSGFDERVHAERISKQFGTDHTEREVTPQDLKDFLPHIVDVYDEPLADATSIPMHFISDLARSSGTVVVLTGDGADELFCGYRNWMRYARLYRYYHALSTMPAWVKRGVAKLASKVRPDSAAYEIFSRASLGEEFFWGGAGGFKESVKQSVISEAYAHRMAGRSSYRQIQGYRKMFERLEPEGRADQDIDWMTYLGFRYIVPNMYLYRADRVGMHSSIELRVPFLDHEFASLALSVPAAMKTAGGEPKAVLKKALRGTLSDEILYRKKQGFCVPLQEWAGDIMLDFIGNNARRFSQETGLFNENAIKLRVAATQQGKTDYVFGLWNIYFLMAWFDRWLM